jgi:hypothetical protein
MSAFRARDRAARAGVTIAFGSSGANAVLSQRRQLDHADRCVVTRVRVIAFASAGAPGVLSECHTVAVGGSSV